MVEFCAEALARSEGRRSKKVVEDSENIVRGLEDLKHRIDSLSIDLKKSKEGKSERDDEREIETIEAPFKLCNCA